MRASKQARALTRWREQSARFVAAACNPGREHDVCGECLGEGMVDTGGVTQADEPINAECRGCGGSGRFIDEATRLVLAGEAQGGHFDVTLARSYAEKLIAEGERLERERAVFADWTRERGKGPENRERGGFAHRVCPSCEGEGCEDYTRPGYLGPWLDTQTMKEWSCTARAGGWPGHLAREWAATRCIRRGLIRDAEVDDRTVAVDQVAALHDGELRSRARA